MKTLIAGDFCPKDRVAALIDSSKSESLLHDVMPIIQQSDLAIVNLECPLVSSNNALPIIKDGPNLKSVPIVAHTLNNCGFSLVTLANNHILDYGSEGLQNTMYALKQEGLEYVGAGNNLQDASRIYYYKQDGVKLAIINCCEHEFSIAKEDSAGANPLNPIQQWHAIREAQNNADYVLIIVHGGHEHYPLPSPRMQETYRFFVDAGADAVINHHQHCYSGYEVYKGKPIFYGLGNFCFDWGGKRNSKWNYGYMVELRFEQSIDFTIYPYEQCNTTPDVHLLVAEKKSEIENDIITLNEIIKSPFKLQAKYEEWIQKEGRDWLVSLLPISNRYLKALIRRGFLPLGLQKSKLALWLNRITCESHRDKLTQILMKQL